MILHELDEHTLTPSCGVLRFGCERDARALAMLHPLPALPPLACLNPANPAQFNVKTADGDLR